MPQQNRQIDRYIKELRGVWLQEEMELLWDQSVRGRKKNIVPYRNVIMWQPLLQQQVSRAYRSVLAISLNDDKKTSIICTLCYITLTVTSSTGPRLMLCVRLCGLVCIIFVTTNYLMTSIHGRTCIDCFLKWNKLILLLFYSLKLILWAVVNLSWRENRAQVGGYFVGI